MKEYIEKEKNMVEEFLKNSMEHQDKKIDYILYNPNTKETNILASDPSGKVAIEFTPITKNYENGYSEVPEWDYNFDYYIYNLLEESWEIAYMTPEVHYSIWNSIKELYPNDIDYKDGVQYYLQYCKDNGITKEFIDKETNLDTPNIMDNFTGLAINETMNYLGYVIQADDINYDSEKETIVSIYKSNEDYMNRNYYERISLNTVDLKQNIIDYMNDVYIVKEDIANEKGYFTFVLGYDLLNNMIKKYGVLECDINYDFCSKIAEEFLNSKEYSNLSHSSLEMLEKWLENNKDRIEVEYKESIGYEDKIYNDNMTILNKGLRKDQPIALVERTLNKQEKDYIIAFNYNIKDDKLSWRYGYYYDNNKTKAENDFEKVISGGNLSKTFENMER